MNNTHVSKPRAALLFFIIIGSFCIALCRLAYVQLYQHRFFTNLAQQQYQTVLTISPARALIYDRNNKPLALNKDSFAAFIVPKKITPHSPVLTFLQTYFPSALEHYYEKKDVHFMYVKRRLSPEELDLINNHHISDIHILVESSRFYPLGSAASSVIGSTNIDNQGLFGLEWLYNTQLTGTPSTALVQKDARSHMFYFSKEIEAEEQPGKPITTTLDSTIQFLVQELVQEVASEHQAQEAGALIMDPETGDIIALVSVPTCDPNNPSTVTSDAMRCRPITDVYEFGSVMKIFSALAALDEHVVTPDEEIDCLNTTTTYLNGRRINTVAQTVLGKAPFKDIIKKSNNIGIAKVAQRLGPTLYDHYTRVGFGQKTGIDFPGEQSGFIMPPEQWSKQSLISLSYGYEITISLIQLARAFCIFCNGGYLITPRLLQHTQSIAPVKIYNTDSINALRDILEKTPSHIINGYIPGYTTLGKTGTANIMEQGTYNKNKQRFCFVGSIEKDAYKRVIACYVTGSKHKGILAASVTIPLFKRIAETLIMHDHIM